MKDTVVDGTIPRLFEGKMLVSILLNSMYSVNDVLMMRSYAFMKKAD